MAELALYWSRGCPKLRHEKSLALILLEQMNSLLEQVGVILED